jgi:DNA-directed RNA polymerase omega subunit
MVDFPDKIDSKFRYVLLAAHRAEQIMRGSQPKLPQEGVKNTTLAMEEISADVVHWDYGPAEELPPEEELGIEETSAPEVTEDTAPKA